MLLRRQLLYNLPLIINDTSLLVSSGTNCLNLFQPIRSQKLGLLHQFYRVQNSLLPFLQRCFVSLAQHLSRGSNRSHSSETWPVRKENVVALKRAEMRMVRWRCGDMLKDRFPSKERLSIDDIALVLQQNRLRWY